MPAILVVPDRSNLIRLVKYPVKLGRVSITGDALIAAYGASPALTLITEVPSSGWLPPVSVVVSVRVYVPAATWVC